MTTKDKILKVLKIVAIVAVIVLIGWTAYTFKFNIGGLLARLRGKKKNRSGAILDESGKTVGTTQPIVIDKNPMRDRTSVTLENGEEVQLPDGVKDTDVERVTVVKGAFHVEAKHTKLTDVFD